MPRKEYFAYGSNLNFGQMAYRCPEATVVGTAKLDDYELVFRCGYLTILPKEGSTVEGLIWSITDHDESQLNCYEGYPMFYDKETMMVTDANNTPHEIMVYTMNAPYRDQLLPVSSRYNAVVMQGCKDAFVYGTLSGSVHCCGEAIILPGTELRNPTPDLFILNGDKVYLAPGENRQDVCPQQKPKVKDIER